MIAIGFGVHILAIGTHKPTVDWLFFVSATAAWGKTLAESAKALQFELTLH